MNVQQEVVDSFEISDIIIHFDGKKFQNKNDQWVEHIVVSASFGKRCQALDVEVLLDKNQNLIPGTGLNICDAVRNVLDDNVHW